MTPSFRIGVIGTNRFIDFISTPEYNESGHLRLVLAVNDNKDKWKRKGKPRSVPQYLCTRHNETPAPADKRVVMVPVSQHIYFVLSLLNPLFPHPSWSNPFPALLTKFHPSKTARRATWPPPSQTANRDRDNLIDSTSDDGSGSFLWFAARLTHDD